jgi:hypothetical protein
MNSVGAEQSLDLFPPATWTRTTATTHWEVTDYPGLRPRGSWLLTSNGELHGLDFVAPSWKDRETGEQIDVAGRRLLLAYGSNPDPRKLLDREGFFGGDRVVALRAAVFGWAAAWCNARRQRDGAVVSTLAPVPGRVEVHPVLALTSHQCDVMDRWEGHPTRYVRTPHQGPVVLESGELANGVEVYLGTPAIRPVLTVAGRRLLCSDVPYAQVDKLVPR